MITLKGIFEESTRLLQAFNARPLTKHVMKKVMEEALEQHEALLKLDRRPQNFILKQAAAQETCDLIVTAVNAYYARGGTDEELEAAMHVVFDKNREKDESTHFYDGETVRRLPNVAYIQEGES